MYKNKEQKEETIIQIHNKVLKFFNDEKINIDCYIQTLSELYCILLKNKDNYDKKLKFLNSISAIFNKYYEDSINEEHLEELPVITYKEYKDYVKLIQHIDFYISKLALNEINYNSFADNFIEKYNELINKPINSSFIGKKVKNNSMLELDTEYKENLKDFISKNEIFNVPCIPDQFIDNFNINQNSSSLSDNKTSNRIRKVKELDVYNLIASINKSIEIKNKQSKKSVFCECIKKDENKIENKLDNSCEIICAECGTIYTSSFSENITYNDYSRININPKYHYEKRCHFRDTINQFQGKQNRSIPEVVYEKLEEMLEKHKLIRTEEKQLEDGSIVKVKNYDKVLKKHIRLFLSETGFSKYYEDEQLIYNKITGKEKLDISQYESKLFEDFDKLVKAYSTLKEIPRTNLLNSHYVLRQLLLRQGVKVADNVLHFLKTPQRLREHDEIYKKCCEILGWEFTPMRN